MYYRSNRNTLYKSVFIHRRLKSQRRYLCNLAVKCKRAASWPDKAILPLVLALARKPIFIQNWRRLSPEKRFMCFWQFCSLTTRQAGASVMEERAHTAGCWRDIGVGTQKSKSPATLVQVTGSCCGRAATVPRFFLGPNVLCSGS